MTEAEPRASPDDPEPFPKRQRSAMSMSEAHGEKEARSGSMGHAKTGKHQLSRGAALSACDG